MAARERVRRRIAGALALAVAGALALDLPWTVRAQTPTFSTEIDVAALDVNVVDKDGRPIRDLRPEEFEVTVDGRLRRVVSAQFVDLGGGAEPATSPTPPPIHYSTNEGAVAGRMVLIVVDEAAIRPGGTRMVADAAGRLLNRLGPQDRSALLTLPGRGSQQVDFTSDHAKVLDALKKSQGRAPLSARRRVSLSEALSIEENDRIIYEEVVLGRECPDTMPALEREICINDVVGEALRTAHFYRDGARNSLKALRALFEYLRGIEGPKTLIFVSEGLVNESTRELRELAVEASAARVTFSVLSLEGPSGIDASLSDAPQGLSFDTQAKALGLDLLASLARGTVYRVTAAGDRIWDRLARELTGYWLLGFEPEPGDRDGKEHDFRVKVTRKGAEVRARRAVSIPKADPGGEGARETLLAVLRAPYPATELPIRVASYALHDAGSGKARVVVSAEIGRSGDVAESMNVGFVLIDAQGRIAANVIQRAEAAPRAPLPYLGSAVVEPGLYTLKLAALDARGRRGSITHPVKAALHEIGGARLSDLMLSVPQARAEQRLRPGVDLAVAGPLLAYTELQGGDETLRVRFEVAASEDGPALMASAARVQPAATAGAATAQGLLPAHLLPPGDYVARARVASGGRDQGQLARPFSVRVRRAGELPAGGTGLDAAALAPALPHFDLRDLREPALLTALAEAVAGRPEVRESAALRAALDQVRAGAPQAALDALSEGAADSPALAVLRGIGFLGRGDARAARMQWCEESHEGFVPPALLSGACHATRGEHAAAARAFEAAIAQPPASSLAAALAAEAHLRAGDAAAALAVAERAAPSLRLQRAQGLALALRGQRAEAAAMIAGYLDERPDDAGAGFALMRVLFERYARGETPHLLAGDERLLRHARAYVAARGPQHELVARWLAAA
jgi:VWFA-related protein